MKLILREDREQGAQLISQAYRQVATDMIRSGLATTVWDINNGWCEEASTRVEDILDATWLAGRFEVVQTENFTVDGEGAEWDWPLLAKHWGVHPPIPADHPDARDIAVDTRHLWITRDFRHYDAEAPDGVSSLFDLPIFKSRVDNWYKNHPEVTRS